jgi:hypothetical protein
MKFDGLNRVRRLVDYASLNYTLMGRLSRIGYDNGVVTTYQYDDRGRPENIHVEKPAPLREDGFE